MGDVLTINKILAAIDLGADTEKILAYAEWLSKTRGVDTQIDMLYVIDYALTPGISCSLYRGRKETE
ncbi:hypothetical protein [Dissulfurispira sp.]|uniref:hypothetical protein n=1 Tax=Dissulfurispira sp. TaxID=2817609 RepID=UPI002FDB1CEA